MEILLQLILTACIVNFGLSHVQPQSQVEDQFQNLLDSIAKNNTDKSAVYHGILKQKAVKEQRTFDAMKLDLRIAQNRNAYKKLHFYKNSNIDGEVVAAKRETDVKIATPKSRLYRDWMLIEKEYKDRHPCTYDVDIFWREVHNLTRESHKKICDNILPGVATPEEQETMHRFRYVEVPAHVKIKKVRYIDDALLLLEDENCMPMHRIPVIECRYKEKTFYVTHGDDNHVFNLRRDENLDVEIFHLAGLIVRVDYDRLAL